MNIYNKIFLIFFISIVCCNGLYSQVTTDSIKRASLINEICDCSSNQILINNGSDISKILQTCLEKIIYDHPDNMMILLGLSGMESPEVAEKKGNAFGIEIINKCAILKTELVKTDNKTFTSNGRIQKVISGAAPLIVIKDEKRNISNKYYFEDVKSQLDKGQNSMNQIIGKKIIFTWGESYKVLAKDSIPTKVKVIKSIIKIE